MGRSDVLALNEQVGMCSALIWFAALPYLMGANSVFEVPGYKFPTETCMAHHANNPRSTVARRPDQGTLDLFKHAVMHVDSRLGPKQPADL